MISAEERGKKLGFLIASLEMSAQQREAMLSLLPEMTEEQLDELSEVLEASYLQAATADVDKKLAKELETVENEYQKSVKSINKNTNKELDSIV